MTRFSSSPKSEARAACVALLIDLLLFCRDYRLGAAPSSNRLLPSHLPRGFPIVLLFGAHKLGADVLSPGFARVAFGFKREPRDNTGIWNMQVPAHRDAARHPRKSPAEAGLFVLLAEIPHAGRGDCNGRARRALCASP